MKKIFITPLLLLLSILIFATPYHDLPTVNLQAIAGETVLAPTIKNMKKFNKKGLAKTRFQLYAVTIEEVGPTVSMVIDKKGNRYEVPNALVMRMQHFPNPQKGDIVISWNSRSKRMQKFLIHELISDRVYAYPLNSGSILQENALPKTVLLGCNKGECLKLENPLQIGSTFMNRQGGREKLFTVLQVLPGGVLAINSSGQISTHRETDCQAVPIKPSVFPEDEVWAAYLGNMYKAMVDSISWEMGTVWVNMPRMGEVKSVAVPWGSIFPTGQRVSDPLAYAVSPAESEEKEGHDPPQKEDAVLDDLSVSPYRRKHEVGGIHYRFYPVTTTTAKVGEYVLSTHRLRLEDAYHQPERANFIFYAYPVKKVGTKESTLISPGGNTFDIPNSLIIPLGTNASARKGQILLTWWQSGSGMRRAIVVDDTNPHQPIVRYIDVKENHPVKIKGVALDQLEEQLKPNSFIQLNKVLQAGISIAVADPDQPNELLHRQLIKIIDGQALVMDRIGRLSVHLVNEITPLPIKPKVQEGALVKVPYLGKFYDGIVKSVDQRNGRVFVEFTFAKKQVVGFGYGDVWPIK